LPRQAPEMLKRFTLGILALDFLASLWLFGVPWTKGWHFQHIAEWVPSLGIRYHVAVDGISAWLVLLTTLSTPIAVYVSFGSIKTRIKDLCFAFLMLQGAMLGAFVALDLFLFFVFWELLLVPMILLIGVWGGVERIKAAYKFFLFTMVGSMLMLAAILYLVYTHNQVAGYPSFDYLALSRLVLPATPALLCFLGFFAAFAIKVPMVPVHTWPRSC
jgi:NADH-quinone oxidoreductase subunit M